MNAVQLKIGDQVLHPAYGFGVLENVVTRDDTGNATDYYGIRLTDGGVLTVPVARAEALGLRRVVNSMSVILRCLRSQAKPLPDDDRQRVVELKARWHSSRPQDLAHTVRDLVGRSRSNKLTPADKKWLSNACDRLSAEAALVDAIDVDKARAALQDEVERLKTR